MEVITILLISDDLDYARALSTCITAENKEILFTVISGEDLEHYTKVNEYHIIVADYMINHGNDGYINLVEMPEELTDSCFKRDLYRYDTAEKLSKQLILLYCQKTGSRFVKPVKGFGLTVFFCSAAGGTGKTSVALGLAQELVRFHGKSVLYINYEEVESTNKYFIPDEEKSLANYLYYIETNKNLSRLIDSFTITDAYGVSTFSASKGRNPLKLLNIQELAVFLELVQSAANFDYILIDGDNSLNEENLWLISVCDKICKIDNDENGIKEIYYNNYLEHYLGKQISDKMIEVINYFKKENETEYEKDPAKIYIDYDTDSFFTQKNDDDFISTIINIERDFGVGIKQLSTKLTLNLQ